MNDLESVNLIVVFDLFHLKYDSSLKGSVTVAMWSLHHMCEILGKCSENKNYLHFLLFIDFPSLKKNPKKISQCEAEYTC